MEEVAGVDGRPRQVAPDAVEYSFVPKSGNRALSQEADTKNKEKQV